MTSAPTLPSLLDDPMSPAQILFGWRGRVPRKVYWLYGVLGPMLVAAMLEMLLGIVGAPPRATVTIVNLLLAWPCVAVAIKRWHDRDKSGWWVLINLIPVIGWIWSLIENGMLRGSAGTNRFGADPTDRF